MLTSHSHSHTEDEDEPKRKMKVNEGEQGLERRARHVSIILLLCYSVFECCATGSDSGVVKVVATGNLYAALHRYQSPTQHYIITRLAALLQDTSHTTQPFHSIPVTSSPYIITHPSHLHHLHIILHQHIHPYLINHLNTSFSY